MSKGGFLDVCIGIDRLFVKGAGASIGYGKALAG